MYVKATVILLIAGLLAPFPARAERLKMKIEVNTDKTIRTMQGGIGASWHALSREVPLENFRYDYPVREVAPRGSAYGGNPPVEADKQWKQLYGYAGWLGLDWIRVELSQAMYEPERGRFDWENEEMRALYRILDWCEASGADVFLQQMWGHVEWNAYPGVHPLLSAPHSLKDFSEGLAALVEHLIKEKKYTCIKWLSITNEPPGGTWGYWWCTGSYPSLPVGVAFKAVREEFDRRGIALRLSGPDWTDLPPFDAGKLDFDPYLGAYDIHSYQGVDATGQQILAEWARWAHARNKPFFLSEMGNMKLGWGRDNPGPKSFAAALSLAETVIRGIHAGVDGFNRWSFVNRGDLDGQWQLVRTWDAEAKRYLESVEPEPEAFYGFGMVTRFLAKNSSVLEQSADEGKVLTASLLSPGGRVTTILLNAGTSACDVSIRYAGARSPSRLYRYEVTRESARGSRLDPVELKVEAGGEVNLSLLPASITVVSGFRLQHEDMGIISEK